MSCIFRYIKPYLRRMTVGLVIKVLATIAELLIPWALAYMVDEDYSFKECKNDPAVGLRHVSLCLFGMDRQHWSKSNGVQSGEKYHRTSASGSLYENFLSFQPTGRGLYPCLP